MYSVKKFSSVKRFVYFEPNIRNLGEWSCSGAAGWIKRHGGEAKTITFDRQGQRSRPRSQRL